MDQDRGRDFRRKKFSGVREKEEKPMKRPIILMKAKDGDKSGGNKVEELPTPTILLKPRDGDDRAVSPQTSASSSSKTMKDADGPNYQLAPRVSAPDLANILSGPPQMKCCVKLLDDETQTIQDGLLDFLTEYTDFLVVGCIGSQGCGKSTLLSHLANPHLEPFDYDEMIFKPECSSHFEVASHCTDGIEAYVTNERVILLDSQPILSLSVLLKHYNSEGNLSARSCSRDDPEYPCIESDMDLLSLQHISFMLTVCHVVIFLLEDEHDSEVFKFLGSAEMLKPSTGVHADDETLVEYLPHAIFVHNKTDPDRFTSEYVRACQENYKQQLKESQLPIQSGIGIANGIIMKSLAPETCRMDPINFFLLSDYENVVPRYENVEFRSLVRDLRIQILGMAAAPLTHTVLTEKNWWHYAVKIWEDIKKCSFYPEYGRLLPTPTTAKTEINQT